ncbi:ion channel [Aneurinibacillus terranovensis]|uniref:ion channel n=1 Tax=Aneurinibacillus terranovensis TaxID=278991 RepID=UPI00040878D5
MDHFASDTHQAQSIDLLTRSLYFSTITLLSVGYGDITPFGWAKGVAMIEAMIGYILPASVVINYLKICTNEEIPLK